MSRYECNGSRYTIIIRPGQSVAHLTYIRQLAGGVDHLPSYRTIRRFLWFMLPVDQVVAHLPRLCTLCVIPLPPKRSLGVGLVRGPSSHRVDTSACLHGGCCVRNSKQLIAVTKGYRGGRHLPIGRRDCGASLKCYRGDWANFVLGRALTFEARGISAGTINLASQSCKSIDVQLLGRIWMR